MANGTQYDVDVATSKSRRAREDMVSAELAGKHTHQTEVGIQVHIWQRGNTFIARGRFNGRHFGETLGDCEQAASHALRRVLDELDRGAYLRPSERRGRTIKRRHAPRLTLRELCDEFLREKRALRGEGTANDYATRLAPLLAFAERTSVSKRYKLAESIDREFALEFKPHLLNRRVTPNGHSSTTSKVISPRQVYNVLDCARSLFNWAIRPEVHKVRADFLNPFTEDVVGQKPRKDVLRRPSFPLDRRIGLVEHMDAWQLSHLALSLTLPLRPEDFSGLLISEVSFSDSTISVGTRFEGRDYTKGVASWTTPFPSQLAPILRYCVAERGDGPLLRKRSVLVGRRRPRLVAETTGDVEAEINLALSRLPASKLQSLNDQKKAVRATLRRMGGVSGDQLAKEFKTVLVAAEEPTHRFYELRSSLTTELKDARVNPTLIKYMTGHAIADIMGEYMTFRPHADVQPYFDALRPLLDAMVARAHRLGMLTGGPAGLPAGQRERRRILRR